MSKRMIIYELYKLEAQMNQQALDGVIYGVRKVEAVTRPFRVAGTAKGDDDEKLSTS